jgi:flavorubredoxin
MAKVDEVVKGIYRISTEAWGFPITLNQFIIAGEHPALIHTGTFPLYDDVRKAVAQILDPASLEYIVVPHFESDECGGMDRFVAEAPKAVLVCSEAGSVLNLSGWNYSGPVRGVRDGDVIELGEHRLRFLETPHVHHWDSMMAFEETTGSLFPADLFIQPGDQPAVVEEDLSKEMCALYREVGIFPAHEPVLQTVGRIEKMKPLWIHPMHGGSLPNEVIPRYIKALRSENFAYEGKIFGRELPT